MWEISVEGIMNFDLCYCTAMAKITQALRGDPGVTRRLECTRSRGALDFTDKILECPRISR